MTTWLCEKYLLKSMTYAKANFTATKNVPNNAKTKVHPLFKQPQLNLLTNMTFPFSSQQDAEEA